MTIYMIINSTSKKQLRTGQRFDSIIQQSLNLKNYGKRINSNKLNKNKIIELNSRHKNEFKQLGKIKFIDHKSIFLSRYLNQNGLKKWMVTKPYADPEDLKNKNITEATGIYSLDCFRKWFYD